MCKIRTNKRRNIALSMDEGHYMVVSGTDFSVKSSWFETALPTCTPLFTTALFTTARTWKQPRCPLVDEWVRKLWYIYTVECYSVIKKNTFESVLMRWMKLEPIILYSEVSQKENTKMVY